MTREEFEEYLERIVELFDFVLEDDDMKEDVYQALDFYYSPWPHLHNESVNLQQLGQVSQEFSSNILNT